MMGIPASQRGILTKTENAIRACDPRAGVYSGYIQLA